MESIKLSCVFVFLMFTLYLSATSDSCEIYKFVTSENQALDGHVIKTVVRSLVDQCWNDCVWLSWCMSINVRPTNHGAVECDLNNSSKRANPGKLVTIQGSQYQEMGAVDDQKCSMYECKRKEDLGDGWFRYGKAAIKLFQQMKNWTNARVFCQSLGGDLLSITSSHENKFVYDMFVNGLNLTYDEREMKFPDLYWKFDGYEPGVSFSGTPGGARYQSDDGEKVLHFTGDGGYAVIPSAALDLSGFTITLWLKYQNSSALFPTAFMGFSSEKKLQIFFDSSGCISARVYFPSTSHSCGKLCNCFINEWCHFSWSWNATNSTNHLVLNGHKVNTKYLPTLDMKNVTVLLPRFGLYMPVAEQSHKFYNGSIKHFMMFNRSLTIHEMRTAMNWHEQGVWIGLNDQANTNTFQWSDGTPVSQLRPLPGYNPQPVLSGRKCVAMRSNRKWLDKHCLEKKPFICERPAP